MTSLAERPTVKEQRNPPKKDLQKLIPRYIISKRRSGGKNSYYSFII
jgi:hypothetical protein